MPRFRRRSIAGDGTPRVRSDSGSGAVCTIGFPRDHLDRHHADRVCRHLARGRTGIGIESATSLDHPPRKQHSLRDRYAERVASNCRELARATRRPPRMPGGDPHAVQRAGIERQKWRGGRWGLTGHPDGVVWLARQRLTANAGTIAERRRQSGDVKKDVVGRGQVGERGHKRLVHLLENLPAGPVGLRLLPLIERRENLRLKRRGSRDERIERLVGDDP